MTTAISPQIAGETLDVEPAAETPETETSPTSVAAPERPMDEQGGVRAGEQARAERSRSARVGASSLEERGAIFGAVGSRFATDLATTFTRAIPQAFSADPAWLEAAFGSAGSADVIFVLDDSGHMTTRSTTGSASPALRSSIERTFALLAERTFTARRPITRLHLVARVGRDDLHDGLHGDVFALSGGSFAGALGSAFFALPARDGPGRRVDIQIRPVP